jgi:hypothetical protein
LSISIIDVTATMKNLTIVALSIILAAIILGLIYQQIEINNLKNPETSPSLQPSPTESLNPSPVLTPTPRVTPRITPKASPTAPTGTPAPISSMSVSYLSSREDRGGTSKVTLNMTATYISGNDVTIDYLQFHLLQYVFRMTFKMQGGNLYPINKGNFTIGASHKVCSFQLIFNFYTYASNGWDESYVYYDVGFSGPPSIHLTM